MFLENKEIQTILNAAGYYSGSIDGILGPKTLEAANKVLDFRKSDVPNISSWSTRRRIVAAVQLILKYAGYSPGAIDGFDGHLTGEAYDEWNFEFTKGVKPTPWREEPELPNWGKTSDLNKLYGPAGSAACTAGKVVVPFKMKLAWDLDTSISSFKCHEKVADSLTRIYKRVESEFSPAQIKDLGLDLFGGCYNYRNKIGGTTLSMHAYGIAVDTDPLRNQLKWTFAKSRLGQSDAVNWHKIWEAENWLNLGKEKNYDTMHTQIRLY